MNVIGHDDELVQQIDLAAIVIEGINQEFRPTMILEESSTAPGLGRDHVGLTGVARMFSLRPHLIPQGLKPPLRANLTARLKARPFKATPLQQPTARLRLPLDSFSRPA